MNQCDSANILPQFYDIRGYSRFYCWEIIDVLIIPCLQRGFWKRLKKKNMSWSENFSFVWMKNNCRQCPAHKAAKTLSIVNFLMGKGPLLSSIRKQRCIPQNRLRTKQKYFLNVLALKEKSSGKAVPQRKQLDGGSESKICLFWVTVGLGTLCSEYCLT